MSEDVDCECVEALERRRLGQVENAATPAQLREHGGELVVARHSQHEHETGVQTVGSDRFVEKTDRRSVNKQ